MKQFLIVFILAQILQWPTPAFAAPPSEILMEYNAQEKILHVEVKHISTNIRDHYIRRLIVYKNDIEVSKFTYARQSSPSALIQDLSLDATVGDVIRAKAICNESGPEEETFIIP